VRDGGRGTVSTFETTLPYKSTASTFGFTGKTLSTRPLCGNSHRMHDTCSLSTPASPSLIMNLLLSAVCPSQVPALVPDGHFGKRNLRE